MKRRILVTVTLADLDVEPVVLRIEDLSSDTIRALIGDTGRPVRTLEDAATAAKHIACELGGTTRV